MPIEELLVFAALIFICGVQSSQLVSDPCTLVPTAPATSWYGGLSPVRACFTSIPFSATRANATITLLRQLLDLYVFTDILKDTGAPWNQKIDLVARLDQIAAASYTSDYAFQSDVVNLFNSLNDAHTRYVMPYPYANIVVIRPFGIQLVNENGTLRFYVTQSSYVAPAGSKYYVNFDPSPYFGGELTAIDGTPILEWFLVNFGNNFVGTYKDPVIRFNAALKALGTFNLLGGYFFSINDISDSCTMTINGTDVVAPYLVIFNQGVSSTANAIAQIDTPRQGKRSTAESEFVPYQPDLHREQRERLQWVKTVPGDDANRKRFDYNSLNTKAVQKRSNQQASDQYVLSVKTGNSSNFNIVTQSSDKSIWWGTYTTTDAQVVPYLRIYSFAPNNSVEFVSILTAFSNYISTNQIDRVLVDVSGNGGGTICLGYQASSIFSSRFRGVTNFERYDVRRTASNSDLVQGGYLVPSGYLQISNGQLYTDNSWFNPRTVTRGGQSSTLSQQVYFPSECYADMDSITVSRFPADPIIITDGTCGSTCSLFTTKFVEYGVGRVFTYGGVPGTVMDSTSFGGGNIEDWSSLIQYTSSLTLSNPIIAPTTSAAYTFTHHEMYSGTTVEVPREYRSMPGLYHSYFYDLFTATTTQSSQQALADLYETAVVAWTITPPVPVSPPVADVTPVTPITNNVPSSTPITTHSPGSRPTAVVSVATSVVSQTILLVVTFFCLTL